MNQQILATQVEFLGIRAVCHYLPSQRFPHHTQVDLVPVMVQVAVVKIPKSLSNRSPWPCTSVMMTHLQMTHTKLFPLMMSSLFPSFQDRILKDSTVVTTFQLKLLHFKGPTVTSWVMLDLATLVHLPLTILSIIKDMWLQNSTMVLLSTPNTLDSW